MADHYPLDRTTQMPSQQTNISASTPPPLGTVAQAREAVFLAMCEPRHRHRDSINGALDDLIAAVRAEDRARPTEALSAAVIERRMHDGFKQGKTVREIAESIAALPVEPPGAESGHPAPDVDTNGAIRSYPSAEAVAWLRWVAGQCPPMSDYKGMSHEHAAELLRFVEGQ